MPFQSIYGKRGAVISAVDLLKGIAKAAGMGVYEVKGATGTINTNFAGKANAALKALIHDGYDFVYLHIEAPDECSHQKDLDGKIKSIELIDSKIVKRIANGMKKSGTGIFYAPASRPSDAVKDGYAFVRTRAVYVIQKRGQFLP